VIDDVRPDTVLTFGPDGITGHEDHRTVGDWTAAAFDRAAPSGSRLLQAAVPESRLVRWGTIDADLGVFMTGYPIAVPADRLAVDLRLDPETNARKVRALQAQATQTTVLIEAMGMDTYTAWVSEEAFVERTPF